MTKMLPVCSATVCCSTHSQASIYGGIRSVSTCLKSFDVRCNIVDRVAIDLSNGVNLHENSFRSQSISTFCHNFTEDTGRCGLTDVASWCSSENEVNYSTNQFVYNRGYPMSIRDELHCMETGKLQFVENPDLSTEDKLVDFTDQIVNNTNALPESISAQSVTIVDKIGNDPSPVSDPLSLDTSSLSSSKTSIADTFTELRKIISESVNEGENALTNSVDAVISSVTSVLKDAKETVNNVIAEVMSSVDGTGNIANRNLTGFSNDLKQASGKMGVTAIDALRHTIVVVEDSLTEGAKFIVNGYGSVKELLPQEVQEIISLSEEKTTLVLKPLGTAFQQTYVALEELEKGLGIDPNDPVVTFVLFVGASATLWGVYRVLTYGGYSGDLSPQSTLELLKGKENAVLIDIRPEDLRERDGIPDLRRRARFKYADVPLLEVDRSTRKVLRGGKDLEDMLLATVIRNLKIVQDRSKVIVMDADGTRSKGIARSLRKLGIKRSYLLNGGFRSWIKEGLRIKELKPETTLAILNEEAEAILEEISPTPLQFLGYGAGFIAAAFATVEWEKTLQLVGVLGLGITIYRRLASYEDAEAFKQDLRLLVAPVRVGGQAILSAATKLETNRNNGLPTSPSSTDVQNRVLQAAAKHESQPSDDGVQDPSPDSLSPVNDNVDLSEA